MTACAFTLIMTACAFTLIMTACAFTLIMTACAFTLIMTACASATKKIVGATVEITVWSQLRLLHGGDRAVSGYADNVQIDRSAILTSFVPLLHHYSDWSNLAFHWQKLQHALSLRAAISACFPPASKHATWCEFYRTTKSQVSLWLRASWHFLHL